MILRLQRLFCTHDWGIWKRNVYKDSNSKYPIGIEYHCFCEKMHKISCAENFSGGFDMKLFFDTEFTGLHKNTTLISIGIISENGQSFYAEFTDYDESQCDDWIITNVIDNLVYGRKPNDYYYYYTDEQKTRVVGSKANIKLRLLEWLDQFEDIQFVSDVSHYDFVLLVDIFGSSWDLPSNVSPCCHDINQDIAIYYHISEKSAFDMSREEILDSHGQHIVGRKHNSFYDAEVIKKIYEITNFPRKHQNGQL